MSSIAGSSHAGSSRASGAASAMSGVATGTTALRNSMFLMLFQLEIPTERKWVVVHHVLVFLQLVGFVTNTHFRWANLISEGFAYPVYGVGLPFFDETWTGAGLQIPNLVLPWVALAVNLLPPVSLLAHYVTDAQALPGALNAIVAAIVHACGSWLFIPVANVYVNHFVCDATGTTLFWNASENCGGPVHVVYFVLGIVGLLALLSNAFLANSLAFEDTWSTGRWSARSRPFLAEATTAAKLAIVICYHVLLSRGFPVAFSITGLCIMLALAAFGAFTQPFYVPQVNSLICALACGNAFAYAGSIVGLENRDAAGGGGSFAIFFGFPVAGLVLGSLLPLIRRNGDLSHALRVAAHGGDVHYIEYEFPGPLPDSDKAFSAYKHLEPAILSEAQSKSLARVQAREERQRRRDELGEGGSDDGRTGDSDEDSSEDLEPPNITTPFIRTIYVSADVELAIRFLRLFETAIDTKPTETMIAFACRIYTKGMLRFRGCAALAVDFQTFLFTYAFQPRLALSENEALMSLEPSLTTMYRGMKLQLRLKAVLNITDQVHTKTVKAALRLHKEVLGHMSLFWSKLLADKVDVVQLAAVVNSITQRRSLAQAQFRKALRFATKTTLIKYARFLEQVMHDTQSATLLTQFVADQEAERKGASRNGDGMSQNASSAMSNAASNIMARIDSSAAVNTASDRSSNIARLSALMHFLIVVLSVVIGLFFAYEGIRYSMTLASLDRLSAAAESRSLAAQGAFLAEELIVTTVRLDEASAYAAGRPTVAANGSIAASNADLAVLEERRSTLRAMLIDVSSRFTEVHNDLTRGNLQSTYAPLIEYIRGPRVELVETNENSGLTQRTIGDLWTTAGRIGSSLNLLATTSTFNSTDAMQAASFLRLNSLDQLPSVFNATVDLHRREAAAWNDVFLWVLVGLTAAAFVGLVAIYSSLVLNFGSIGAAKLSIIGLFALIPRVHLEALQGQSRDRISQFDVEDPSEGGASAGDHDEADLRGLGAGGGQNNNSAEAAREAAKAKARANLKGNTIRTAAAMSCVQDATLKMWDRGGSLDEGNKDDAAGQQGVSGNNNKGEQASDDDKADDEGIVGDFESAQNSAAKAKAAREASQAAKTVRTHSAQHDVALRTSVSLAMISATVLLLVIAAFGIVVEAGYSTKDLREWIANERATTTNEVELSHRLRSLAGLAQGYALSGDSDLLEEYIRVHAEALRFRQQRDLLTLYAETAALQALVARRQVEDSMLQREYVALLLSTNGYGEDAARIEHLVSRFEYNMTLVRAAQASTFAEFSSAGVTPASVTYPSSDNGQDAVKPSSQLLLVSRALLMDSVFDAHFSLIERYRRDYSAYVSARTGDARSRIDRLFPATIALLAATVVGLWGSIALLIRGRTHGGTNVVSIASVGAWLIIATCFLLANIGVLGYSLWLADDTAQAHSQHMQQLRSLNISASEEHDVTRYARSFASFGSQDFFGKYRDAFEASGARQAAIEAIEGPFVDIAATSDVETVARAVTAALHAVSKLASLTSIGVRLAAVRFHYVSGSSDAPSPGRFAVLDSVYYDREQQFQEDLAETAYNWEAEYSSRDTDAALDDTTQDTLARATLANTRFTDAQRRAASLVSSALEHISNALRDRVTEASARLETLTTVVQALAGVSLAMLFASALHTAFAALQRGMTGRSAALATSSTSPTAAAASGSRASTQERVLFGSMTRKVLLALALLAMAVSAVFGFALYATTVSDDKFVRLNQAAAAEWNVARSALLAQEALSVRFGGTVPDVAAFPTRSRQRLRQAAHHLLSERSDRYADMDWVTYPHTDALFGGHAGTDPHSRDESDCDLAARTGAPTSFSLRPSRGAFAISWTGETTDAMLLQWARTMIQVGATDPVTRASTVDEVRELVTARDQMVDLELATYRALRNDTADTLDYQRRLAVDQSTVHYALCGVALALLVCLLFAVFRPMIQHLLFEDDGTRLLLRMIPKTVRSEVPAIQEYLEHGTVTQNEKLQRISDMVSEMSTVAYVVIDNMGTVLRFSRAASEEFGHDADAVIGQNVKMLMPHFIAKNHDMYLRRYRETGVKHVVDRIRRVKALRKDGTTFGCEIEVKEFKRTARDSVFLGFVRNIETVLEYEKATKLNEAVSDMAEVPVVVMDKVGQIFRVNRATTEVFGYSVDELVNRNVKMLMSDAIAKEHDRYLSRYQQTRIATVVNSTRGVTGRRRNGEEFAVTITVREMCDDLGQTLFFIGYIRDQTQELLNRQGELANRTVVDNSPTPVIQINPLGTILKFSPAAERSWGYTAEEVIGQNVRMLMNPSDAGKHDGYLLRYQKTGEKRVIDMAREVLCMRKNKELFPAILNIKELRKGDQVSFIGYVTDLTEQNQRLTQTRVSQASLSASPLPIVITREDGSIADFNAAAERFSGYRQEEVIHKNVKVLMPEDVAAQHDGYLRKYQETGVGTVMNSKRTVKALHKNGELIDCDLHLRETVVDDVTDEAGKRTVYIGFIVATAATRKLEKANAVNNAVCDLVTVPMLSIDSEGTVLLYNRAAERVFGYKREEVENRNIKMLMPIDIALKHDGYLRKYAETGEKHVVDSIRLARGKRKNGETFPLELKIREVAKKGVDPIFVGYARDISEELELKDAKMATDAVLDRSSAPVIAIDLKGTIVRFSAAAERLFRWNSEDIIGKNVKVLMPRDYARNHDSFLAAFSRTGVRRLAAPREVTGLRKDGHTFPMELTLRQTRTSGCVHTAPVVADNGPFSTSASGPGSPVAHRTVGGLAATATSATMDSSAASDVAAAAAASAQQKGPAALHHSVPPDTLFIGYVRDMSMTHVLKRSNEMRDVVLDNATIPMLQIDDHGKILYVNPAACQDFGYTREEMVGENIKFITPDDVRDKHDGYLRRYRETGKKHIIDTTRRLHGRRKTGELFPMEISVREIEVDGEKRFVGYVRNISEEMRIEDGRHTFSVITNLAPVPMVAMSDHGIIELVNQATIDTFGWSREELIGKNIKVLQPKAVADRHDDLLAQYRRTGVKRIIGGSRRIVAKRRNGDEFPAEITVQESIMEEREDTAGASRGPTQQRTFVGYVRDITQRVSAEMANQVATLTAALSPIPLILMDTKGTVLQFSRAAQEEWNFTADEVIGQNIKMLQPDDVAAKHDGYLAAYLATRIKHVIGTQRRVEAKRKDGSLFPIELNILEVEVPGTDPVFIGFARSLVEELKQAENFETNLETCNLLPVPFIAMTANGTIIRMNTAGLRQFGYDWEVLQNQNVKILMPEAIAVEHDAYLESYRRTGKKKVVDSVQRVTGRRSNGTTFAAEIAVREMFDELKNRIFFGFIRDMSGEAEAAKEVATGNAVTSMSLVPLLVLDDYGKILRFSESAEATFGHKRKDIIGQNVKMLMPKDFGIKHDGWLEAYRRTRKTKVIGTTRAVPAVRADGTVFTMQLRVSAVDNQDRSATLVGYCDDISGQLRDEEEAAILHVISDLANIAVIVISVVGIIERVSRAACNTFKYSEAELIGQNVKTLMPSEIADIHDNFLNEYARSKQKHIIDSTRRTTARTKHGQEFPIEIGVTELTQNGVTRFVGFVRDITDEVTREQEIGFSDAIFSLATLPIIIADNTGRIVRCSNAITPLLGFSAEEATGRNLKSLMPAATAAQHDDYLQRYLKTGVKHIIDTTRVVEAQHKNGNSVWVKISVRELKSKGGNIFFAGILERTDKPPTPVADAAAAATAGGGYDEDAAAPQEQAPARPAAVRSGRGAKGGPAEPGQAKPAKPPQ
jgi:PAS domain S-box-containing protein